jgi:hypothetical protein
VRSRFRIFLPFPLLLRADSQLLPYVVSQYEYEITINPPTPARLALADLDPLSSRPLVDILEQLVPMAQPEAVETVLIEGQPILRANLLQIDFRRTSFDRRPPDEPPPSELIFDVVNRTLAVLRNVLQATVIRPLAPDGALWRLDRLDDDGGELPNGAGLWRYSLGSVARADLLPVTEAVWGCVLGSTPGYAPPAWADRGWGDLLLDAEALLPEVGPAIVLAHTCIETFIEHVLDDVADRAGVPPDVFDWIMNRPRRQPPLEDQLDSLLRAVTGRSLRDESRLWQGFQDLARARNSFVHGGQAIVDRGQRQVVTAELAAELIGRAREIVVWLAGFLRGDRRHLELRSQIPLQHTRIFDRNRPTE